MGNISRLRKDADQGNALIMVIGLGFAFVIIGITLAIATTFAASTASNSRAGVQAQGAADGGVDSAINVLNNVEIGKETGFVCSLVPTLTTTAHGTYDVETTVMYRQKGAPVDTYSCTPGVQFADGTEIVGEEINSVATLKTMTANGPKTTVRSVQQTLEFSDTAPVAPVFKYGMFSDGFLDTSNSFKVTGGGVFTNSNFKRNNQTQISGDVTALGNAVLSNKCSIGKLTTGQEVSFTSGAHIKGNLTASSPGTTLVDMCTVDGDVWTGGDIDSRQTTKIGDNALSATGKIHQASPNGSIDGWAQAAQAITGGTIAGAVVPNQATPAPAAPAREEMPAIEMTDLVGPGAGNPDVQTIKSWLQSQGEPETCPTDLDASSGYTVGDPSKATVIDASDCHMGWRATKLKLAGDVTFVVKSWNTDADFPVTGAIPGETYKLRVIVPLPPGMPSCSGSGEGQISHTSGTFSIAPEIEFFLYTNGSVVLSNAVKFSGSVYACHNNLSNGTDITYTDITPPGMGTPGGTQYNFIPTKRFDLR